MVLEVKECSNHIFLKIFINIFWILSLFFLNQNIFQNIYLTIIYKIRVGDQAVKKNVWSKVGQNVGRFWNLFCIFLNEFPIFVTRFDTKELASQRTTFIFEHILNMIYNCWYIPVLLYTNVTNWMTYCIYIYNCNLFGDLWVKKGVTKNVTKSGTNFTIIYNISVGDEGVIKICHKKYETFWTGYWGVTKICNKKWDERCNENVKRFGMNIEVLRQYVMKSGTKSVTKMCNILDSESQIS